MADFVSLPGLVEYGRAREQQLELVERRARDEIADTVLFVEHEPVVTRGRGLQWTGEARERAIPLLGPLPLGMAYSETERGGDLTYHGPGQLVVYPICKLDGSDLAPNHDVASWVRTLEMVVIRTLGAYGLKASTRSGATGVWIGDRKIASIGIAVRKWVSFHGIGLNVVNDLRPFHAISPCGFAPEVMTRLQDLAAPPEDEPRDWSGWRSRLEAELRRSFERESLSAGCHI